MTITVNENKEDGVKYVEPVIIKENSKNNNEKNTETNSEINMEKNEKNDQINSGKNIEIKNEKNNEKTSENSEINMEKNEKNNQINSGKNIEIKNERNSEKTSEKNSEITNLKDKEIKINEENSENQEEIDKKNLLTNSQILASFVPQDNQKIDELTKTQSHLIPPKQFQGGDNSSKITGDIDIHNKTLSMGVISGVNCETIQDCMTVNKGFYNFLKNGLRGVNGKNGKRGPEGERGDIGETGDIGEKGENGYTPSPEFIFQLIRNSVKSAMLKVALQNSEYKQTGNIKDI